MENNGQPIYIVVLTMKHGVKYYLHNDDKLYWNIWNNGVRLYKSKKFALRKAVSIGHKYKDYEKVSVLEGHNGMRLSEFTEIANN